MSTFSLIYKLNTSINNNEWNVEDLNIIKSALSQLQKWLASFNWVLIHWFDSLQQLQVLERACDKYENWVYYIKVISEPFKKVEYEDASFLIDWFDPRDKDITNELFLELWITTNIKNYNKLPWFIDSNYINIKWIEVELKENTKYWNIFGVIYDTNLYKKKNDITYDELIESFKLWNYKYINEKDLRYNKLRDLIKHKLNEIREATKIKFLWLHKDKIVLWEK